MIRKALVLISLLAMVAAIPAVASAADDDTVTTERPYRMQLQVDPENCDGVGYGPGYGLRDGSEFAPQPGDGTGFGAGQRGTRAGVGRGAGSRGAGGIGPMDGSGIYHPDGAPIAPRDGTGLQLHLGRQS
jgi:hypothetical protein